LLARLTFMSVASGAHTILFAAAAPDVRRDADAYRGAFLVPVAKLGAPSRLAQNEELALELWDTTERLIQEWEL
jgi:hypothetical protein